ncbi:hypothetical protein QU593_18800 [Rossellomorea marisflavi]|nr:hypothetical protein [Rossellomorea marisflavi]WJV21222.1 hypothetical protein QU593_18800 [Rossellomorea marisflavi]
MSELERYMNRERMVTGLAAACSRGRRGGRPKTCYRMIGSMLPFCLEATNLLYQLSRVY